MEHQSCAYGLRHQTRCLSAVRSDDGHSRFIIGTQELLRENEVHLLTFDEDTFEISTTIYSHPHEIWDISASKDDSDLFFTCYKVIEEDAVKNFASLWRMVRIGDDFDDSDQDTNNNYNNSNTTQRQAKGQLEKVLTLDVGDGSVKRIIWQDNSEVISVEDWRICLWDINVKDKTCKLTGSIEAPDKTTRFTAAVLNPHAQEVVACYGRSIQGWDLNSLKPTFTIKDSQPAMVLCIDYNPNKPFQIATGGDDCKVRIWDIRKAIEEGPIMTIQDHTHWVWSVAYNRFHDQLVLTSSSDCQVNLQSIVSVSTGAEYKYDDDEVDNVAVEDGEEGYAERKVPSENDDDRGRDEGDSDGDQQLPTDGLVHTFDQHEDSVYQVAWSRVDPWLFLSLSYDGRAVMNQVPNEEKFKIIMN